MGRGERALTDARDRDATGGNVVPLEADAVEGHGTVPPPSGPASRLHGASIAGMALSALAGIASTIAFITVGWTGSAGHVVVGVVVFAAVAFLAFASIAVFTAARDAYPAAGQDAASAEDHEN